MSKTTLTISSTNKFEIQYSDDESNNHLKFTGYVDAPRSLMIEFPTAAFGIENNAVGFLASLADGRSFKTVIQTNNFSHMGILSIDFAFDGFPTFSAEFGDRSYSTLITSKGISEIVDHLRRVFMGVK